MKKLLIGLLTLGSIASFAYERVSLNSQFTLISDTVENVEDGKKYSNIRIKDNISNRIWLLDDTTNKPNTICKLFGSKKALAFEVKDIRRTDLIGRSTERTCKLKYIDFSMWDLMEEGKFPLTKQYCDFNKKQGSTNFAFSTVTCI